MTCKIHWGLPPNCALRRGTLIVGVPKRDPKATAVQSAEEALQKKIAEHNGGTVASPKSETTNTPMCSRNSVHEEAGNMDFRIVWNQDGRQGSGYMELLPGEFKGKWWNLESAFIHEAEFEGPLEAIFAKHAPDFDHYGNTAIGKDQCWAIIDDLKALGSSAANELAIWLHGIVAKHGSITVLGI
jgi:hypothetical protein